MTHHPVPLRSTLVPLALAALLGGSSGCASPSGVPLDDIPSELAGALCSQVMNCTASRTFGGSIPYLSLNPAFEELCPEQFIREFGAYDYLAEAVERGTLEYDPQAARRCITDMTESCVVEAGLPFFPSCREALRGLVPVGGTCTLSDECVPGSRCDAEEVANACVPGECVARLPLGAACDQSSECVQPEGAGVPTCRNNGGPNDVCMALTLTFGVLEDEPCGSLDEDGLERGYGMCGADFFCDDPDDDGTGTCQPPLATGATCIPGQACEFGSVCLPVGMQYECKAVTIVTTAGGACDDEVTVCDFSARLVCDGGECTALEPGACADTVPCGADEYCDGDTSTCETRNPNGTECESSSECTNGSCADDGTMTGTRRCSDRVMCG